MNCKELCERFNLPTTTITELKKAGLINCDTYTDDEIDRLNNILTLKNAGIPLKKIKDFISIEDSNENSVKLKEKILQDQRRLYTKSLHNIQKNLDRIDYLIYELNQIK